MTGTLDARRVRRTEGATPMPEGDEEFTRLTDGYRTELLVHCYRMLGSIHDAEDLVQETYLRAWRSYGRFEGRSSLRAWLYKIATNACLTALRHRSTRVLPSGLAGPSEDPEQPLVLATAGVEWVEPLADPAAVVAARGSVRLALISALQYLPARQRAVLILRDVLAWRASETAELLDTTTAAVNSALQRARAQLERLAPLEDEIAEPTGPELRRLVDQYVVAFEQADMDGLLRLLREDVALEMPPHLTWFRGREAVGRFIEGTVLGGPGVNRLLPTTANGQPALAIYRREGDGLHHGHGVQLLTVTPTGIARMVTFLEPELVAGFGLAPVLE
ncbi:sigma-70 family RNA polymerase sigma factor [Kitasatospora sp. McL0602]|uniref:sigma-70 family RNA polymerase sigma factor n=1 Tax=Kitasatospora sp. McL0602 TaxID=3439530 RepID=UPI003F8A959D